LEKCPKRRVVDSFVYNVAPNPPANPILSKAKIDAILPESDENWNEVCVCFHCLYLLFGLKLKGTGFLAGRCTNL